MAANLNVTLEEYAARYGTPPDPERVSALLSDACDMLLTAYEGRFGYYVAGANPTSDLWLGKSDLKRLGLAGTRIGSIAPMVGDEDRAY